MLWKILTLQCNTARVTISLNRTTWHEQLLTRKGIALYGNSPSSKCIAMNLMQQLTLIAYESY